MASRLGIEDPLPGEAVLQSKDSDGFGDGLDGLGGGGVDVGGEDLFTRAIRRDGRVMRKV